MIAAAALALTLAAQDPLAAARAALASGDPALAERLALQAAVPPVEAKALYLAGVARFRDGRPAEALDALDRAGPAGDAPGPWHYNRGACLLDLGRREEAERAFVEAAAADPQLAAVALVNAGFAALEAGALDRAGAHASAARAASEGPGVDLVRELERGVAAAAAERAAGEYAAGLAAFDAGRYEEARRRFLAAADLVPSDGKSRLMAGAAALRRAGADGASPDAGRAREDGEADVRRALALGLAAEDARVALAYLESPGVVGAWSTRARVEGGYDSNALQTGARAAGDRFSAGASPTRSALASVELGAAWSGAEARLHLGAAYDLAQLAYEAADARDYSVQQHALALALDRAFGPLRLGAGAEGQLAFAGLEDFRGLLASGGLRGFATLAQGARASARLELAGAARRGLAEFDYLGGWRGEAGLTQELALTRLALRLGYRFLLDDLGTASSPAVAPRAPACDLAGCIAELRTPSGYAGHLGWAAVRLVPVPRLTLDLSAGLERRVYLGDDRFRVQTSSGALVTEYRERRRDWRLTGGAAAAWRLGERLSVAGRWELVRNASTLGPQADGCGAGVGERCRVSPLGDRNHVKHVFTLGASAAW